MNLLMSISLRKQRRMCPLQSTIAHTKQVARISCTLLPDVAHPAFPKSEAVNVQGGGSWGPKTGTSL